MRLNIILSKLLLAGTIVLQGCLATMISTPKQGVRVNSKPTRAAVYVNEKKVGNTPIKVRLKRKKNSEIRIEKEGFKDHVEILYPSKVNPLAYASCLFLYYPYAVDLATGAGFRLNKKELNINLIKLPAEIKGSQAVICDEVNVKFKAGDKLGNFYIKDEPKNILYFEKSLDVDATNLKESINSILKDAGFDVVSEDKGFFSSSTLARYLFIAEVKDINYNIRASHQYESQAKYETTCKMKVLWKLTGRNKDVKFEKSITSLSTKFEKGGLTVFYDAFENSFYKFMDNKKIYEIVKKGPEDDDAGADFSLIYMEKPRIKVAKDKLINNATKGVVTIQTKDGHGSGCVISSDGYIVTNLHVVYGHKKVQVKFRGGISIEGNVIRVDDNSDLALVKVSGTGFNPLKISESKEINIGSDVYAIGTPADKELGQTVTKGIISGERNLLDNIYIQTDVSINPGSSGGALINKSGTLIGIINAKIVGNM